MEQERDQRRDLAPQIDEDATESTVVRGDSEGAEQSAEQPEHDAVHERDPEESPLLGGEDVAEDEEG